MRIAEMTPPGMLKLPAEILSLFRPADRLATWANGDTWCLQRTTTLPVTRIVEPRGRGR